MKAVGVDLSLTATGVCTDKSVYVVRVPLPPQASEVQRVRRLREVTGGVWHHVKDADFVAIEGHSYSSQMTHAHSLGELHGAVKLLLFHHGIPFVYVPPSSLKMYATGKGNAPKDAVLAAAVRHCMNHELPFDIRDNNEADAFWLRDMTKAHYEQRDVVAPDYRNKALRKVRWPQLEERKVASV